MRPGWCMPRPERGWAPQIDFDLIARKTVAVLA
jgi:hypothetical protein